MHFLHFSTISLLSTFFCLSPCKKKIRCTSVLFSKCGKCKKYVRLHLSLGSLRKEKEACYNLLSEGSN